MVRVQTVCRDLGLHVLLWLWTWVGPWVAWPAFRFLSFPCLRFPFASLGLNGSVFWCVPPPEVSPMSCAVPRTGVQASARAAAAILGAVVGDAAAVPSHWQYDPTAVKAAVGEEDPALKARSTLALPR